MNIKRGYDKQYKRGENKLTMEKKCEKMGAKEKGCEMIPSPRGFEEKKNLGSIDLPEP